MSQLLFKVYLYTFLNCCGEGKRGKVHQPTFFLSFANFLKKIKPMLRKEKQIIFSINDIRIVISGTKQFLQNHCTDPFTGKASHYINIIFDN